MTTEFWDKVKKELEDYKGRWGEFTDTVTNKVDSYRDLFPTFENFDDFKDYFGDIDEKFEDIKKYITKKKWDTKGTD